MLKKLLCLLLALMMVVSLMACDSDSGKDDDDDDDEEIVDEKDKDEEEEDEDETEETSTEPELTAEELIIGSWVIDVALTEDLLGIEGFETTATLPMMVTFYEDGTLILGWHEEGMEESIPQLEADMVAYMCELMYTEMEASGYSREETDEAFEAAYGYTVEEYCAEYVAEMDLGASMLDYEEELEYEIDGDVLITGDEEIVIEVDEDTLVFVESNMPDSWEAMGIEFPAEWDRVE